MHVHICETILELFREDPSSQFSIDKSLGEVV